MSETFLQMKHITKRFPGVLALNDVQFSLRRGEVHALLGENGAGKSTLMKILSGVYQPDEGEIIFEDKPVSFSDPLSAQNVGITIIHQEFNLFPELTVEENIAAVLEMKGVVSKEQQEIIEKLMEEFKLTHVRKSLGYSLSGGERRRIEIARTIANNPSFILLDEPFAGVDPIAVEDIQQIIRYLRNRGLGILITDHSVRETLRITEKAYIMANGKVLISGTPEEISNDETARKIYLGEKFKLD